MAFYLVAVPHAHPDLLTYEAPVGLEPGTLVGVEVGKRTLVGVVCRDTPPPTFPTKTASPFPLPPLPVAVIELARFAARYWLAGNGVMEGDTASGMGRVAHLMAPGFVWDAEKLGKTVARKAKSRTKSGSVQEDPNILSVHLRADQTEVLKTITAKDGIQALLFGATGTGKTEVYLEAVENTHRKGQTSLVLVPELSLTPQMSERFRARFGNALALLHSGLSPAERQKEWLRVLWGEASIVLGVRTALFAPLRNLGLLIVDEEHDASYKSPVFPAWHARDLALVRARHEGARCLLGSATPSLETWLNVASQRLECLRLSPRPRAHVQTHIVRPHAAPIKGRDPLRSQDVSWRTLLSPEIREALLQVKEQGHQSLVLFNRRGWTAYLLCTSCQTSPQCPRCTVSWTLHRVKGKAHMSCHWCGAVEAMALRAGSPCPSCASGRLVERGAGTQRLEEELQSLPGLRVERVDRDTMTSGSRLKGVLERFRKKEIDILVGTQTLSKGHDFSNVTAVVLVHLEDGLFLPDIRAGERTFQLLCQSVGRVGRAHLPGSVWVQSFVGDHPLVRQGLSGDVEGFLQQEMQVRSRAGLPPFSRQILMDIAHRDPRVAEILAVHMRRTLEKWALEKGVEPKDLSIVGPYPAAIEKIQDTFHWQINLTFSKKLTPWQICPPEMLRQTWPLPLLERGVKDEELLVWKGRKAWGAADKPLLDLSRHVQVDVDPQSQMGVMASGEGAQMSAAD